MNLTHIGWNESLNASFAEHIEMGRVPIRISLQVKDHYMALTEVGEIAAETTGRLRYDAVGPQDFPVVGDWAAATIFQESPPKALIHAVIQRKSLFCRKEAGKRVVAQPVAANVDFALVVVAMDQDFSPNRIERYLTLARECDASPVVVLTKSDACGDAKSKIETVKARMMDVPVIAVSALSGEGMEMVHSILQPGKTYALLGSSGVGKSTLVNSLLGEYVMRTREVRLADSKGRHTTTHRQLFVLPSDALIIDTPGMRELQLWDAEDGIAETFPDIDALSCECRFPDCRHTSEPGCAILAAVANGSVDSARLENYRKMSRELQYLSQRQDEGAARLERARWKNVSKLVKEIKRKNQR